MDFSEILGAIVLGVLAGFIARALLPGKQSMGLLMTILLGLAGSFVGFLIFAELLDIGDEDAFDLGGLIGAIIGAMLLLFLYERFAGEISPAASKAQKSVDAPVEKADRDERRAERQRRNK